MEKYPTSTILVRELGTWMTLNSNHDILETKYSDDWPTDFAEIVICENDPFPENDWIQYLTARFPKKEICTLSNFYRRTVDAIYNAFEQANVITFTTTFSDLLWYEKLIAALEKITVPKHLIFQCKDNSMWNSILAKYPISKIHKLEIIEF